VPDPIELETGEAIRSRTPASFRGAAATTSRATFAVGSARYRMKAFDSWAELADIAGFPVAGPEMVLLLTDRRILVCKPTFFGKPKRVEGAVPLTDIAEAATMRHGMVTGLAIAMRNGRIVEVEAMRGARVRRFATVLNELLR
jgi:hypothetical protein